MRTRKSVATRDLPRRKAKKFDRILAAEPQPLCVVCIEPETALFAAKARERLGANFPIVLAVHNDPRYLLERKGGPSLCLERLAKQGTLDSVIVLDDDYTRPFTRMGFHDVRTIRNPSPNLVPASDLPSRLPKEAAMMGSLVGRKNVAAAIRVWSEVVKRRPGWTLRIYGTGDEESELRHLTESLGIDGFVRFEGDTSEPQEALARAQFLLHTSVLEGWPMVIVEAASVGTPTVAFEASAGVRTLVRDSGAGMLVPLGDESALRDAILSVIDDEKHRQQLGERATMVSAQYPLEEIGTSWIETFDRLIEQRRLRKGV